MKTNRFIINNGIRYEEDSAWQNIQIDGIGSNNPSYNHMIKVDSNTKPWGQNYPHSRRIDEFEASDSLIISTTFSEPSNTVHRRIAEGEFYYSASNTLAGGTIKNFHTFITGVDGINLYSETHLSFEDPVPIVVADWELIYEQLTESEFTEGKLSKILQPVNPRIKAKYAFDNWEQDLFGNDFITNAKVDVSESEPSKIFNLRARAKYKKQLADKITNFNPSTDTLEIDTDNFGIDSSATFESGKNKKIVKKKLAKQDFDFLYDQKKGGLYFNENGADKGFGDGGIIAVLKGAPDLTLRNIEFL